MRGGLLNKARTRIDPCAVYTRQQLVCPSYIRVGDEGVKDILALQTLLEAAGVNSIDEITSALPNLNSSRRYDGLVLAVDIYYTNYYSADLLAPGSGVRAVHYFAL